MFDFLDTWLAERMLLLIPLIMALTVHEWAHAWAAWKLGDPTSEQEGRLSLNPLVHIDPIGTLLLPLLGVPFGWAKPVPFNQARMRGQLGARWGALLTAAAGPASNCLMAFCALCLLWWNARVGLATIVPALNVLLLNLVILNVLLAIFNLLPIPPLDGSHIFDALMPRSLRGVWHRVTSLSPLLLAAIIIVPFLAGFNLFEWPLRLVMAAVQQLL